MFDYESHHNFGIFRTHRFSTPSSDVIAPQLHVNIFVHNVQYHYVYNFMTFLVGPCVLRGEYCPVSSAEHASRIEDSYTGWEVPTSDRPFVVTCPANEVIYSPFQSAHAFVSPHTAVSVAMMYSMDGNRQYKLYVERHSSNLKEQ